MSIDTELAEFRQRFGFTDPGVQRTRTVPVYTGCMLVPLPNIESRRRFLKFHDIHHLMTDYSVGRIGEGEISAWELGTGSAWRYPILGVMNLIALSTGLFLKPGRMWLAWQRGCRSKNIYDRTSRKMIDDNAIESIESLKQQKLEIRSSVSLPVLRSIEFGVYCTLAILVHLSLVIPAIVLRFLSDTFLGGGLIEAVRPKQRTDLF